MLVLSLLIAPTQGRVPGRVSFATPDCTHTRKRRRVPGSVSFVTSDTPTPGRVEESQEVLDLSHLAIIKEPLVHRTGI